jgi:2-isopropylmalate synthase
MSKKRVYIFDTTLRDGEQAPGCSLNIKDKLEIARELIKMRVDVIEAGFPIASVGDFEAVKEIAQNIKGAAIAGLARANYQDIDRAWEAVKYSEAPRIHTFIATSNIHLQYKLKMTPEEALRRAVEAVKHASKYTSDVEFSAEDASRSDPAYLYQVYEAVIAAGATTINVPDTVGYTTPREFGGLIKGIRENVGNIDKAIISVHCHNDLGMAVANSLAAVENGAQQVECTINGLGERAGNAALEEVIMALLTRQDYFNIDTAINTQHIYRLSRLVSTLTGVNVQPNKAIVGANAFAHESGIHQHGMLSNSSTYEIMKPETIGLQATQLVLGKHSGRHAFEDRLKELGHNLGAEEINRLFIKFKELADKKKVVFDRDIEALLDEKIAAAPGAYELSYYHISSGNQTVATGTVRLQQGEETVESACTGDGPVDACFKAIEQATGIKVELEDYFLKAVTSGEDALGEVTVKVVKNGKTFTGRGLSTDIIESSVKAFVNAINKLVAEFGDRAYTKEELSNTAG